MTFRKKDGLFHRISSAFFSTDAPDFGPPKTPIEILSEKLNLLKTSMTNETPRQEREKIQAEITKTIRDLERERRIEATVRRNLVPRDPNAPTNAELYAMFQSEKEEKEMIDFALEE